MYFKFEQVCQMADYFSILSYWKYPSVKTGKKKGSNTINPLFHNVSKTSTQYWKGWRLLNKTAKFDLQPQWPQLSCVASPRSCPNLFIVVFCQEMRLLAQSFEAVEAVKSQRYNSCLLCSRLSKLRWTKLLFKRHMLLLLLLTIICLKTDYGLGGYRCWTSEE